MSDFLIKLNSGGGFASELEFADELNAPVNLTGADIRFTVTGAGGSPVVWSTANGKVPITSPATGGKAKLILSGSDVSAFPFEYAGFRWEVGFGGVYELIETGKVWKS